MDIYYDGHDILRYEYEWFDVFRVLLASIAWNSGAYTATYTTFIDFDDL